MDRRQHTAPARLAILRNVSPLRCREQALTAIAFAPGDCDAHGATAKPVHGVVRTHSHMTEPPGQRDT